MKDLQSITTREVFAAVERILAAERPVHPLAHHWNIHPDRPCNGCDQCIRDASSFYGDL
jgi:hypothetical protein